MGFPERIVTPRLVLRRPVPADAPGIFENYARHDAVTRYLVWPTHTDLSVTAAFLRHADDGWRSGSELSWAITLPEDGAGVIGMIGLRPAGYRADFGYVLAQPFWGRGLMTEAARAVADEAFRMPDLIRLWALCDVDNRASARVLEKCGFSCEGTLRRNIVHPQISPEPRDTLIYARVREP